MSIQQRLDVETVESLETLCPGQSSQDRQKIDDLISHGRAFTTVEDGNKRDQIKSRLMSLETRVLSLASFFEDVKFLEPPARLLLGLREKSEGRRDIRTIYETLYRGEGSEVAFKKHY